jgi:hypothetical protein
VVWNVDSEQLNAMNDEVDTVRALMRAWPGGGAPETDCGYRAGDRASPTFVSL